MERRWCFRTEARTIRTMTRRERCNGGMSSRDGEERFPAFRTLSQKGKKRKKTKKGKREDDDDDKEEEEEVAVGSEEFRKEYVVGTVAETYHDSDSELYEEDQVLENDTEVLVAFEEIPEGANWTRYKEFELFDSEYEEFVL